MHTLILTVILGMLALAVLAFVAIFVLHNTSRALDIVGKPQLLDGLTGMAWLRTKLMGWKTHILLLIAAAWESIQFLLQTYDLTTLPWASVFEGRIANWVVFGLTTLAMLTHADGLRKVASLPPQE